MGQREVDLPQLFSDVSRTISGITNIMGAGPSQDAPDASPSGASTMVGSLFGNTCFKACGMEDIQYAARSAGDMLITLRFCIMATTVIFLLCLIILTGAILYTVCRKGKGSSKSQIQSAEPLVKSKTHLSSKKIPVTSVCS
ncbi:hypothetical protein RB195_021336 [Necator americanus]|uniref:Uncharacterized protein n=1 Tax=Necator americanus TaxID=51031 RepID=A0ABR1EAJ5_NECAM